MVGSVPLMQYKWLQPWVSQDCWIINSDKKIIFLIDQVQVKLKNKHSDTKASEMLLV